MDAKKKFVLKVFKRYGVLIAFDSDLEQVPRWPRNTDEPKTLAALAKLLRSLLDVSEVRVYLPEVMEGGKHLETLRDSADMVELESLLRSIRRDGAVSKQQDIEARRSARITERKQRHEQRKASASETAGSEKDRYVYPTVSNLLPVASSAVDKLLDFPIRSNELTPIFEWAETMASIVSDIDEVYDRVDDEYTLADSWGDADYRVEDLLEIYETADEDFRFYLPTSDDDLSNEVIGKLQEYLDDQKCKVEVAVSDLLYAVRDQCNILDI